MAEKPSKSQTGFRDLKKLWPYLRSHKTVIFFAALLIPVVSFFQSYIPLILKNAIDNGMMKKDANVVITMGYLFLGFIVFEYIFRALQNLLSSLAVHKMVRTLRESLLRHVMKLSLNYHDHHMSGALVTRATSDFDNLTESLNQGVLTAVVDCSVLIGCIIGMFALDWKLALFAIIILPVVGFIVRWFANALKAAMISARAYLATLNGYTQECLYGQKTIKLLVAEEQATQRYNEINITYRNAQMRSVVLDALMFSVLDGIASISLGLVIWVAIGGSSASDLSAGLVVAFVQYIQQLFEPLKQLGSKMAMLQGAFTSIERIFGIMDKKEFVKGTQKPPQLDGLIEFKNVSFAYQLANNSKKPVLDDVSFHVETGHSLALVGPTGGGKSTIVRLLTKLYDGYEGFITIDGVNVADLDATALRQQIAVVPQDIVLFEGSIAFNIGLGLEGVSQKDIENAAKLVHLDRFINNLPGGYEFQVREQGSNLSVGERQLIAFARAMARNPRIVVLDEATSSVDPEAESAIQYAIQSMLKGRTFVVIAHRLSTVEKCDQILIVKNGKIAEQGNHKSLLAKQGIYSEMYHQKDLFRQQTVVS